MFPEPLRANPAMVLSDIHSLPILRGPSRTQLLPTLTFQFGSTFGRQLQRLCAELQVVLGSSLVLTPAANTDIHRNQTGLCRSSTGFGLCVPGKLTSPFSLARAGILPGPRRGKKKKHLGAELEGNLPLLLQFSPGACLALLRRPLCLPSQIREYLGFSRASQEVLVVKNLPANAGDLRGTGSMSPRSGRSPGGGHGNPLQSSCWRIPWTEEPGGLQSMGLPRVRHY